MILESNDIDLNTIFNLTYSFDPLKILLGSLLKNEKAMAEKINELEEKLKKSDEEKEEMAKTIKHNQEINDKKFKQIESILNNLRKNAGKKTEKGKDDDTKKKKKDKSKSGKEIEKKKTEEKEKKEDIEENEEKKNIDENNKKDVSQEDDQSKHNQGEDTEKKENKEEDDASAKKDDNEEKKTKQEKDENEEKEEKDGNEENGNKEKDDKEEKENDEEKDEKEDKDEDEEEEEYDEGKDNGFLLDNFELEELKRRVTELEKKTKNMGLIKFPQGLSSSGGNNDDIESQRVELKNLQERVDDLKQKSDGMSKDIDDMKVKLNDFNIYDLFKDCKTEGGNLDVSKLLVMNLENKVFKKFEIVEERLKKDEEDIYKMKNDLTNVKNQNDSNQRTMNNIKDDLKNLAEVLQNSNEQNANQLNELENKFNENYKKLLKQLDDLTKSLGKDLENIKNRISKLEGGAVTSEVTDIKQVEGTLSEGDLKILKDFNRRLSELEKSIKGLLGTINIQDINDQLAKLREDLSTRAKQRDLLDLIDKVNIQGLDISNLKDTADKLIEDSTKANNNINFIIKKFEVLNSTVMSLQAHEGDSINVNKSSTIDNNKYLELGSFQDFVKSYAKDQERIQRDIDDLRRYLDEHSEILRHKASDEDLKNLEGVLNAKIDELRLLSNKRYADKIDTNKSIKYLDAQLKHIIEVYIKKMDKGENWLLAKKPIGGYSCASCEAYLGELQEKGEYVAWNKYPVREGQDKAYRMGNGFSRMLNMLNLDVRNSFDNEQRGDKNTVTNDGKRAGSSLANLKRKNEETSDPNAVSTGEEYKTDVPANPNDPRVVKVFRKQKLDAINVPPKTGGNQ